MDEDSLLETWVTYGVIMRLPLKDTKIINEYLKEKGMLIYDRVSLGRLILNEQSPPSGSNEGGNVEQ